MAHSGRSRSESEPARLPTSSRLRPGLSRPKVRRIEVTGKLRRAVFAKDVILHHPETRVQGGVGYAYEYAGGAFDRMTMEERMNVQHEYRRRRAADMSIRPDDGRIHSRQAVRAKSCGIG